MAACLSYVVYVRNHLRSSSCRLPGPHGKPTISLTLVSIRNNPANVPTITSPTLSACLNSERKRDISLTKVVIVKKKKKKFMLSVLSVVVHTVIFHFSNLLAQSNPSKDNCYNTVLQP